MKQNVAELKQLNEELRREIATLRESELQHRLLVEHASDGMLISDARGHFIFVNARACEMLGYTREELLQLTPRDLVLPEELGALPRYSELQTEKSILTELHLRRKDATLFPAEISSKQFPDGKIQTIARDITARKASEEALIRSVRDYRGLFENAHDAILLFTLEDEIVVDVNERACEMYGLRRNEFIGSSLERLSSDPLQGKLRIQETLAKGGAHRFETTQVRRDGSEMLLEVNAFVVTHQGQRAILSINRDITERKWIEEAERSQRQLAESLAQAAVALNRSLDLDAVLDRILEQTLRVVPCQAVNLMLVEGKDARIARHRGYESLPAILATLDNMRLSLTLPTLLRMRTTGQPVLIPDTLNDTLWHRTPATEWVRSYAGVPLKSADQIIGFLNVNSEHRGFFDGETTRRLEAFAAHAAIAIQNARLYGTLESALQQEQATRDQLIQASKLAAMGRLVASIAHEINNPLQAVQGCLTLTREEMETEQPEMEVMDRYLSVAMSEIERIASIVQRIRDFYRPAPRTLQPSHLHHILDSVLELANKQLQHYNITVLREWVAELPLIECNPDHLKQVFLNLVLNAIDAMMGNEGVLRVRTGLDSLSANESGSIPAVRIEFTDSGEGMSKEVLSHLFEPFFTSKAHGTGLGLSISYRIIKSYHGEIKVASESGRGATFTIVLPIEQPSYYNERALQVGDEYSSDSGY